MTTKTDRIGIRVTDEQRDLLVAASAAEGRTLSEFVLSHATEAAENVLADRRVFTLDTGRWSDFVLLLDRPAEEIRGLRDLMATPSVLELDE